MLRGLLRCLPRRAVTVSAFLVLALCGACQSTASGGTGAATGAPYETGFDASSVTSSQVPPDGTVSSSGLVVKDYQRGTLPTDPYRGVNMDLYGYAHGVYVATCMVGKGRQAPPVSVYNWNDPSATVSGGWGRPDTVEEARQHGYHLLRSATGQFADAMAAFMASQDEGYRADYATCDEEATQDPLFADPTSTTIGFGPTAAIDDNPDVKTAVAAWRECMAPLGIPDLPQETPGTAPSLLERFGLGGADNPDATDVNTLSTEEIDMAVHQAQCIQDSGYGTLTYGLAWMEGEALVKAHSSEYGAVYAEIQKEEQALKDYVNAHRGVAG